MSRNGFYLYLLILTDDDKISLPRMFVSAIKRKQMCLIEALRSKLRGMRLLLQFKSHFLLSGKL